MNLGKFHDKYYKKLLLIPLILIIISFAYLGVFYANNQDVIYKDITLTGGTSITVYDKIDIIELENELSSELDDLNIREIYDLTTREQKAVIIETTAQGDKAKESIESYLGYELVEGTNSDFEFTGSILSESFYKQLIIAILIAFLFMAIVVFIIFRTLTPSIAVIVSAFADIVMTLVFIDIIGMKMSTAGIVAFLMLIGYSVDTDILLTTRILNKSRSYPGSLNQRIFGAFKTGTTMTLTSLFAFSAALFLVKSFSNVLTQIFTILVVGLLFDLLNTWITNVSILKWHARTKK